MLPHDRIGEALTTLKQGLKIAPDSVHLALYFADALQREHVITGTQGANTTSDLFWTSFLMTLLVQQCSNCNEHIWLNRCSQH
jgi:hypothetical protein